jgi:outer membrane lipoprotein SlyB
MTMVTMSRSGALSVVVSGLLGLQGCAVAPAGPSVLVLPGAQKTPAQFQADQAGCEQQAKALVAPGVEAANQQAATTAVVGTAIGAAVGALFGYGGYGGYGSYANQAAAWGAGAGLIYGGAVGSSSSQASSVGLQRRYDNAFAQCMLQSGHQMPGVASYRRAVPAVPPPPPNYRYPPPNTRPPSLPPPNTPPPVGAVAPA